MHISHKIVEQSGVDRSIWFLTVFSLEFWIWMDFPIFKGHFDEEMFLISGSSNQFPKFPSNFRNFQSQQSNLDCPWHSTIQIKFTVNTSSRLYTAYHSIFEENFTIKGNLENRFISVFVNKNVFLQTTDISRGRILSNMNFNEKNTTTTIGKKRYRKYVIFWIF